MPSSRPPFSMLRQIQYELLMLSAIRLRSSAAAYDSRPRDGSTSPLTPHWLQ